MVNCIKQVPQILRQIVCDTIFLSFCEILEMVGKTAAEKWWQIQMDEIIMIQRSQSPVVIPVIYTLLCPSNTVLLALIC